MAIQVLIIEDEPAIADTLIFVLKSEGFESQHVALAQLGIDVLKNKPFDCVLLDIGLPDMTGFEVCKKIRQFSNIPILFLTARSDEVDRLIGLEIGGDDYIAKPFSPREVVARVKVILRRTQFITQDPITPSIQAFTVEDGRVQYCGQVLDLTRYEYLLISHLLTHPNRIFSRENLMQAVWQDALNTADRTVDTHIKTLRAKLRAINAHLAPITTHRGLGYSICA